MSDKTLPPEAREVVRTVLYMEEHPENWTKGTVLELDGRRCFLGVLYDKRWFKGNRESYDGRRDPAVAVAHSQLDTFVKKETGHQYCAIHHVNDVLGREAVIDMARKWLRVKMGVLLPKRGEPLPENLENLERLEVLETA